MVFAVVFPGQGSQSVGMLSELSESEPEVRRTFKEASKVLKYDLWKLVQAGPAERLQYTEVTQPAMLSAGVAVWRSWQERGGNMPMSLAGHSLGEYTALVAAGTLAFEDAVAMVAARGRYMQEAVPEGAGAMAAIMGLSDDATARLCAEVADGEVLSCANFNAPGQVVIAGAATAVRRAIQTAQERGASRAVPLPVSAPFHCELMRPAAERLAADLASIKFRSPAIPVVHNVDAQTRSDGAEIRQALIDQAHMPVKWVDCVKSILSEGVNAIFEFGPGRVLTGLCRRIDRSASCTAVYDRHSFEQALDMGEDA